jgi:hypothetical protein
MANSNDKKANRTKNTRSRAVIIRELSDAVNAAIEDYKANNPDIDVEEIISKHSDLLPELSMLRKRELDKFIVYAKEQGTKMSFDAMEMGVLAAGRKDMQNGLAEIANSVKFDKPTCPECGEEMNDRGRSKKNS